MKSVNILGHTNYALRGIFCGNFIKKLVRKQKRGTFHRLGRTPRQLEKAILDFFNVTLSEEDSLQRHFPFHSLAEQLDPIKTEAFLRLSCLAILQLTEVHNAAVLAGYDDLTLV